MNTISDVALFYIFIGFLRGLFAYAYLTDKEFREGVKYSGKVRFIFSYKNFPPFAIPLNYHIPGKYKDYAIEFVDLRESLKSIILTPNNILGLMLRGKVITDPDGNACHLFRLGYLFSIAKKYMKQVEGGAALLLGLKIEPKETEEAKTPPRKKAPFKPKSGTSPRLAKLLTVYHSFDPALSIQNALHTTEYFKRNRKTKDSINVKWAKALRYSLSKISTPIFDGELIVGSVTEHFIGAAIFPWFFGAAISPDLLGLAKRLHDPLATTAEQIRLLVCKIFPYWEDKNIYWIAKKSNRQGNKKSFKISERMSFYLLTKVHMISHVIPDYKSVVEKGMFSQIESAREKQMKFQSEGNSEKADFFESVGTVLEGVIEFADRYAEECEREVYLCKDETRKKELRAISEMLRHVPANPARTFHEALLAINIMRVALNQENFCSGLSIGPLDRILYPYYKRDKKNGTLSRKQAKELLACFLLKLNDHIPVVPDSGRDLLGGTPPNQAVTIGGINADGSSNVNAVTYLILEATAMINLREPNLSVRISKGKNSRKLLAECLKVVGRTGASLGFYGDEGIIPRMMRDDYPLDVAREYGIVGCIEQTPSGSLMGHTGAIIFNLAAAIEMAIYGGKHSLTGLQIGPETLPLSECECFEDFLRSFQRQLEFMATHATNGNYYLAKAHKETLPTPLLSACIEGTFEKGRDVTAGGARYNSSGVAVVGLPDTIDSLSAVKWIFENKTITPRELVKALKENFAGKEGAVIRAKLQSKAPRFGNGEENTNSLAKLVDDLLGHVFSSRLNSRGGEYKIGYWSMSMHGGFGSMTGALPNGRLSGAYLTSGATPRKGDNHIDTLRSVSVLEPSHGFAANIMVNPNDLVEGSEGLVKTTDMLWVYFTHPTMRGMQLQITAHSIKTLRAAQKDPDLYADLLVRVSGYNSRFIDLSPEVQEEIINRSLLFQSDN